MDDKKRIIVINYLKFGFLKIITIVLWCYITLKMFQLGTIFSIYSNHIKRCILFNTSRERGTLIHSRWEYYYRLFGEKLSSK